MKPLNWTVGLLICVFCPSSFSLAQDSIKEPTRSAPALTVTAYVQPALIARIYDSQGYLENSVTRLGNVEKSILTVDVWNDAEITLKTPESTLYLRRIEIVVHFSGFRSETGSVNLRALAPSQSKVVTLVEGPSPDTVLPIGPRRQKIVSDAMRTGDRFVRYVGFSVRRSSEMSYPGAKCQLLYEVGVH